MPFSLVAAELPLPLGLAHRVVGAVEVPAGEARVDVLAEAGLKVGEVGGHGPAVAVVRVVPRRALAVVAEADAVLVRVVPQVADRRGRRRPRHRRVVGQRLRRELLGQRHELAVVASVVRPGVVERPDLVDVVGRRRLGRPWVAVLRHLRVDVEVVEQREPAGERALVRRRAVLEQVERRVAVALAQVAEDLVVGAVLLDHVDDVVDGGHRRGRARPPLGDVVVAAHLRRPPSQPVGEPVPVAQVDDLHRPADHGAAVLVLEVARRVLDARAAPLGLERRERPARVRARAEAVRVDDHEPVTAGGHLDVGRVPGRRDEPADVARVEVDDRDGVLAGVGDVERPAVRADREPLRHRPLRRARDEGDVDGGDETVAARVEDAHGVARGVGRVDLGVSRVGGDRRRDGRPGADRRPARAGSSSARAGRSCR